MCSIGLMLDSATMIEVTDAAITIEPDRYYLGLWYLEIEEKNCNFLLTASRPLTAKDPTEWVVEYRWRNLNAADPTEASMTATSGVCTNKTAKEVEKEVDELLQHLTVMEFQESGLEKKRKKDKSPGNLRLFDFYPAHCSGKELTERLMASPAVWMQEREVE